MPKVVEFLDENGLDELETLGIEGDKKREWEALVRECGGDEELAAVVAEIRNPSKSKVVDLPTRPHQKPSDRVLAQKVANKKQ